MIHYYGTIDLLNAVPDSWKIQHKFCYANESNASKSVFVMKIQHAFKSLAFYDGVTELMTTGQHKNNSD